MDLQELHWLEWIGFALVAYGLAAGATRGLTQQFTRFLVWTAAVLITGAITPALSWLASKFSEDTSPQEMLVGWFSVATLLLSIVALGGIRRIFFGRVGSGKTFADRLLGGLLGLGVALIAWMTLLGGALHAYRLPHVNELATYSWAQKLSLPYRQLPVSLQSTLFQFDGLGPASSDSSAD